MRHLRIFTLALTFIFCVSCGNYLNVQPQGQVIPKTDEEFASIIHKRLSDIEGGEDEFVIGNMDMIKYLEGCSDNLDANIMTSSFLEFFAGEEIGKRQYFYRDSWEIVRDCNIVIGNLAGRDTETAKGLVSASYAMKGIIYYNLLREFCQPWEENLPGIPLVDNFDIDSRPLRGTMKQTYEYTEKLFDEALALNPTDKKYIFTTWVIKAYKAKLEFWCQNWDLSLIHI